MKKFHVTWDITNRCNKQCKHCYVEIDNLFELNLSELEHALIKLNSTLGRWGKVGFFAFSGGEALLRKNDLLCLMRRAEILPKIGGYQLLTNGSLLTEEVIDDLKDFRKLVAIQLSLESSSPKVNDVIRGKGSFEEVRRAIKMLKENGFRVAISTTISRLNYLDIPVLIKWVDQQGVDEIGFDRLISAGKGKNLFPLNREELRQLYSIIYSLAMRTKKTEVVMHRPLFCLITPKIEEIGAMCSAGINNLSIMPDGTIYPCRWLPLPIGNITSIDLDLVWQNNDLLARLRDKKELKGKCHDCSFLLRCRGCRGVAYFHSGDYLAEDPQCWR